MSEEEKAAEEKATPTAEDERAKLLRLMRFWLFGTFVIVFAAITAYIWIFSAPLGEANLFRAALRGWPIWGITAVACVLIYIGYSLYSKRKA